MIFFSERLLYPKKKFRESLLIRLDAKKNDLSRHSRYAFPEILSVNFYEEFTALRESLSLSISLRKLRFYSIYCHSKTHQENCMAISLKTTSNFGSLPYDDAKNVVYDLLETLEKKGIYLSQDGNLNFPHAVRVAPYISPVEEYTYKKTTNQLLDIERIQAAFRELDRCIQETGQYQPKEKTGAMRLAVQKFQNKHLSYGDFVATMLIKGISCRFGRRGDPLEMQCEFRAEPKTQII
jgi:hypothetical protein